MEIADRIKQRMDELGIKGVDITRQSGITSGGISQWINGATKPKGENLLMLAKVLKCSPEWLLNGKGDISISDSRASYNVESVNQSQVPVISYIQAGEAHEAVDIYEAGFADEYLPCPVPHSPSTYALKVVGESMTSPTGRSYPPGVIIFVDPEKKGDVASGDRVVAKLLSSGEVTFKSYISDSGHQFLMPLNKSYPNITEEFELLGKVIGTWMPE